MAKINKASRTISYHKVLILVDDPDCLFSIKPKIEFRKVFKSTNPTMALKAAASYCNKYMKEYPGVVFKYSLKEVEPYNYFDHIFQPENVD